MEEAGQIVARKMNEKFDIRTQNLATAKFAAYYIMWKQVPHNIICGVDVGCSKKDPKIK